MEDQGTQRARQSHQALQVHNTHWSTLSTLLLVRELEAVPDLWSLVEWADWLTPTDLHDCAARLAQSGLARIRLRKCGSLGTLVPPGRDGKFLTIALDGKRGPPVRRLPKDVELVEQAAPPPPKLEPQCELCGAVATLKCSACAAVRGVLRARGRSGERG